ncbi:MAG: hypothetical protein RBS17_08280 [Coriobacteriia bacterium]|nr:hypothetical protein [Coriobacteriia bacterium]
MRGRRGVLITVAIVSVIAIVFALGSISFNDVSESSREDTQATAYPIPGTLAVSADPLYPTEDPGAAAVDSFARVAADREAALALVAPGVSFPDPEVMGEPTRIVITGDPDTSCETAGYRAVYANKVELDAEPGKTDAEFEDGLLPGITPAALPVLAPRFEDGRKAIYEVSTVSGTRVLLRRAGFQLMPDGERCPVPAAIGWRKDDVGYWLQSRPGVGVTLDQLLVIAEQVVR